MIHQRQFQKLTLLLIQLDQLIDLQQRHGLLIQANLFVVILREVEADYPHEVVVVLKRDLQVLLEGEVEVDFVDDQAQGVPLDVALVLFCVVAQQDAVLVYLDENRADLERYVL